MGELDGKVGLVTGGASGIGRSTALALATEGALVVVADLDDRAESVRSEIVDDGGEALALGLDLGDTAAIEPAVRPIIEQVGAIDILVNCAGVRGRHQRLLEVDDDVWDHTLRVNLTAPMALTRLIATELVDQGKPGHVVNVASGAGFMGSYAPAYSVSKAGLHQLTRSAAGQLGRYGIRVNTIAPGLVDTPGVETVSDLESAVKRGGRMANPLERVTQPEEIAEAVLYLCRSSGDSITGQVLHINAGSLI